MALAAAGVGLAVLTGCVSSDPGPAPSSMASGSTTAAPDPVVLPTHAAGEHAAWVLDQLGEDASTSVADVEARLGDAALEEISPDELLGVLEQLRRQGPWTLTGVEDHGPTGVVVRIDGAQELEMTVGVDGDGRIGTLFFAPPPPPRDPASSLGALASEVGSSDARTSLLVARVEGDRCVPVDPTPAGTSAGEVLPIGSMVKLYVLGAVVDAVAAGELDWTDPVTVTDAVRSLPSGRLQEEPEGTEVTVREAAELMISISDNTATDLLIAAVGRDAVEETVARMGHHDPALNVPLPTTRELFAIGWGDPELRVRWRDGDEAERRRVLSEVPPGPPEVDLTGMGQTPVWVDDVDWFATAADLCAAHVALDALADTAAGEPLAEILSTNPGLPAGAVDGYDHVAFKGGSSVGTMGGAWYAEPDDGGAPVVVVYQSATRALQYAVRAETMAGIAADALRLAR